MDASMLAVLFVACAFALLLIGFISGYTLGRRRALRHLDVVPRSVPVVVAQMRERRRERTSVAPPPAGARWSE